MYPGQKTGPGYVFPSVGRRHLTMLLALAAIWGSSFMFIKVAVRELEPGVVVFGRVFVATLALLPAVPFMIGWRRLFTELRRFARPLVVLALFNASIPFWLLAWGEERLDSGVAAVLQASTPLFTALLAFGFSRSDRVGGARLIGVVVGFLGVVLLIGAQPQGDWLAALAVLLTAVVLRRRSRSMQARAWLQRLRSSRRSGRWRSQRSRRSRSGSRSFPITCRAGR